VVAVEILIWHTSVEELVEEVHIQNLFVQVWELHIWQFIVIF
jgi:hypothetical protein